MAITWKEQQAEKVTHILKQYPAQSNRCEMAARAILPIAREVDASSHAIKIEPAGRAPYLLPKISLNGDWWRHHVTTEVTEHYVDSLTDTQGTPVDDYFAEHYQYDDPDAYVLTKFEL